MEIVLIVMGVLLVLILGFGIYRASTAHLREKPSLKPNSDVNRSNAIQIVITLIVSVAVLVGIFFAYSYFTSL